MERELPWSEEYRRIDAVVTIVWDFMRASDWNGLNEYLEKSDLINLIDTEIVALSRTTYAVRKMLPYWPSLVEAAYQVLKQRNPEADRIMQGLVDHDGKINTE